MRPIALAIISVALFSCKSKKEIPTFRIAGSDEISIPLPSSEAPRPLRWIAPETWEEQVPGRFQVALYRIAPEITAAVSQFPGDAGGILANVNRWREQVGLPPTSETSGDTIALEEGNAQARWFELKGTERSILAAIIPVDGVTWFFKLDSSTAALEATRPAFMDLLKSIEIASTNMPRIKLETPEGWNKQDGDKLRFATYVIPATGSDGVTGEVSVIPLPGDGGTNLTNANLWRAQLRLPPLEKEDDPALGETTPHPDGSIAILHMTSVDPLFSNNRHGAISAAILRTGKVTWFFRLTGEATMVSDHRAKFVNFVRTASIK